jgi:hypothetical protein
VINIRYHIISLTAVFLALGIGLTLGSSFLDRVTVDTLQRQLTAVEDQVRETRSESADLRRRVDQREDLDRALADQLPERVLGDHLAEVPVLVIATDGTDEDLVDRAVAALAGSGAEVAGTWWVTDRWALEASSDQADLAAALGLSGGTADRLRRSATVRLADVLLAAASEVPDPEDGTAEGDTAEGGAAEGDALEEDATEGPDPEGAAPGTDTDEDLVVSDDAPAEPDLAAELRRAGFIDYEVGPGSDGDEVLVAGSSLRIVVVATDEPGSPAGDLVADLIAELASDGPVPVVVAQGPADDDDLDEGEARTTFLGPLRDDEDLAARVSTLDTLDTAAGLAGLVLAVEDLGAGTIGHYGLGPGASRLLPAPVPS